MGVKFSYQSLYICSQSYILDFSFCNKICFSYRRSSIMQILDLAHTVFKMNDVHTNQRNLTFLNVCY